MKKKINESLEKAKKNIARFQYEKRLYFFYNRVISQDKQNTLILSAAKNEDIQLIIIDARQIASLSVHSTDLQNVIRDQYGIHRISNATSISEDNRALYDLISFGNSTIEIKNNVVISFIVNFLYENSTVTLETIITGFEKKFGEDNVGNDYIKKVINKLLTDKKIIKNGSQYSLSNEEITRIDTVKENFYSQEQKLLLDISQILDKHSVSIELKNIIEHINKIFEESFNIDYNEISEHIDKQEYKSKLFDLYNNILSEGFDQDSTIKIIKELFDVCNENDIIQRLNAGKLYSKLIDNNIWDNYVNQQSRIVYIDTSVMLFALCYYYMPTFQYDNQYFQSVKELLKICSANPTIELRFANTYIPEIEHHFKKALSLIPFDDVGLLKELGGTTNVFYNFYSHLFDHGQLEGINTFRDFLTDFANLREDDIRDSYFSKICSNFFSDAFNFLEINVIQIEEIDFSFSEKIFSAALADNRRDRQNKQILSDAKMLTHLFNKEFHPIEPLFATWDNTFFKARNEYHKKTNGRLWFLFTPGRLVNHLSLLKFKISPDCLSRDILSVFDDSFNIYQRSKKLIDTISLLINVKTETGHRYVKEIAKFRQEYIFNTDTHDNTSDHEASENIRPIEKLIYDLSIHYLKAGGSKFEKFKMVFSTEDMIEDVLSYFKDELTHMKNNNDKNSPDYIVKMDNIMQNLTSN